MPLTGVASAIVDQLASAGVRRAYTVPGESFLPLIDAFDRHPDVTLVSTRHESGAAFMAEADARLTGVPAVVMATRAVGAANLSIGVHTAHQGSTPMIVLLGQVETSHIGREAFQEVDLPAFYSEITKWSATAGSRDRLPELVSRALQTATSGRPGPAMVAVPADLLDGVVEAPMPATAAPGAARTAKPPLDPQAAADIARLLSDASAPVIIAGGGAQGARAELIAAAERLGAGVYAAFRRQDVFPNDHPHYCGHLSLSMPKAVLTAVESADVVLVVGCRLSEITTQGYTLPARAQRVVQIDIDPRSVGAVVDVEIGATADAAAALASVADLVTPSSRDWTSAHEAYLRASDPSGFGDGPPLHPARVMAELLRAFPADTVIANDAGNFSIFAHLYWRFTHPCSQAGPASGAMGYGVPGAIGAKLAMPEREVLAIAGDGGFLMTGQEIETAVRHQLAITIVVFRNGLHGTIALHQAREVGRLAGVDIGDVDIASVARGYGAQAWTARTAPDLAAALQEARACGEVAVLDVLVDPDVLTPSDRLKDLLAT